MNLKTPECPQGRQVRPARTALFGGGGRVLGSGGRMRARAPPPASLAPLPLPPSSRAFRPSGLGLNAAPPHQRAAGSPPSLFPPHPNPPKVVAIANDITYQSGAFGPREDCLFRAATELALEERLPLVYLAANRWGARGRWGGRGGGSGVRRACARAPRRWRAPLWCTRERIRCSSRGPARKAVAHTGPLQPAINPQPASPPAVARGWAWPTRSATTCGWRGRRTTTPPRASGLGGGATPHSCADCAMRLFPTASRPHPPNPLQNILCQCCLHPPPKNPPPPNPKPSTSPQPQTLSPPPHPHPTPPQLHLPVGRRLPPHPARRHHHGRQRARGAAGHALGGRGVGS
jgi:hypothetical protein